jgi:cytoskeleton protein RodZ
MARQMGIDPQPVLAAMPSLAQPPQALESVTRGLSTPYREPGSRKLPVGWREWLRPAVIAPVVLLLLALLFWLAPPLRGLVGDPVAAAASAVKAGIAPADPASEGVGLVVADGADTGGAVSSVLPPSASAVVETVHSAPPEDPAASRLPQAAAGAVVLRTSADSWVEVRDGGNAVLLSRMLPAGEVVGLDGTPPLRLKIGNAEGTRVHFRGEPVDLAPLTRDNVARIELK